MKHYNKSIRGLLIFGNIGAVTIAALGLLSYMPGLGLLGSIREDYIPMAPSTAISFIILACCLYAMNTPMLSRLKLGITFTAVILVLLFGFLEVLGFYLGMDLNFEDSIVPIAGYLNDIPIARMSPATGSVFFLSGITIVLLILRYKIPKYRVWLKHTGGILGVLVIITSFTFCLSYIYGTPLFYEESQIIPMALTTALAFLFLGLSIIGFAGRSSCPICYLTGSSISSYLLRYILPLAIFSVIMGKIIVPCAHSATLINPALAYFALTVVIAFIAGILAILIARHTGNVIEDAEKIITETKSSLSESEGRFKAIFEQSGGCFLILEPKSDGSLMIVDANESACEFHGYTKYELVGKSLSELSKAPDKGLNVEQTKRILSGYPYAEETSHVRKDGTTFPIMSYYCRIQVGKNLPLILSAEYDITDLKLAEEEIKKLAMFPDEDPVPVMRVDKDGLLLYANSSSIPLLSCWKTSVNSKLPELWCRRISEVLEENQIIEHEIQYDESSFSLNFCPIKDMGYVNIYGYDITERKKTEDKLRKSEELLNEVGNIAMIGGWEMDLISRKAVWTKGTYDIVEIEPGQPVPGPDEHVEYYLPEYRDMVKENIQQLIDNNVALDYDAKLKTAKGNIKWGHASGKAVRKNGKCVKIYGTFQDVTARKKIEEELADYRAHLEKMINEKTEKLQQVNAELKSFSYSVSHDLRAPLRVLDGFSQVLLEDYKNKLDEEGQDYLQRIRKVSVKMGKLIDSLLKLSRISQVKMKAEETNLSEIAENITQKFIQDSPERNVDFVILPDMVVDGDAGLLEILLDNLLGNAWKFTRNKKKTRIEFSCRKDEKSQETVYYIKDNGAGFNMDYADKLFGAFQRLHTQNEFEGSGIGLATVNRIILRHHGKIWAEGVEGKGAVFYFILNM